MLARQFGRAVLKALGALSAAAVIALMGLEGFSSTPYQDQAGVWTNGYGNTTHVTAATPPVTKVQAKAALLRHADVFDAQLAVCLTAPVSQHQYDAYMLLAYNIGGPAFCSSTTARLHNAGSFEQACDAMLRWDKITVQGRLVPNKGLANRRAKEAAMCRLKD